MSDSIQQRVQEMRAATFATTPQLTLGELIDLLKSVDAEENCVVQFVFGDMVPLECRSWRGSYNELAIGFSEYNPSFCSYPLLSSFIKQLEDTVGATFCGWYGGEYTMHTATPVWADKPGQGSQAGIVGIKVDYSVDKKAYRVYLRTDYCEF